MNCPRCGEDISYRGQGPALSRADNETKVCAYCGLAESMYQHFGLSVAVDTWPVTRTEQDRVLTERGFPLDQLEESVEAMMRRE